MQRLVRLQPAWPIFALAASLAMIAVAHAFERIGGLNPCALCLRQREIYWGAAAIAAGGLVLLRFRPRLTVRRAVAALLGLAFLTGAIVAFYHFGVEGGWFTAVCDAVDPGDIRAFDLNASFQAPNCTETGWSLFGLTMAAYNAAISLALAAASFLVAFAPARSPEDVGAED